MFSIFKKKDQIDYSLSKAQMAHIKKRSFEVAENTLTLNNWATTTNSIDSYLIQQLSAVRARSREQAHNNPLFKRAIGLAQKNIVGSKGIQPHPRVKRGDKPDAIANKAIKEAFRDWSLNHCDVSGQLSFVELQALWIRTAFVDGEFIVRMHNTGKYGLQLETIDPELLDSSRCLRERNGNITRLGVEYKGKTPVAYWFRDVDSQGRYINTSSTRVLAKNILHCYLVDFVDQSRGLPWGYASLDRLKNLHEFDKSALTAARAGASKMGFIKGGDDEDDELYYDEPIMDFSAGTIEKLGEDEEFQGFDPTYPSDSYEPFTKKAVRDVGSGFDMSYASLSGDMSDVNYTSIRYGGQDEREGFIDKQNWMIRCAIQPIYEQFIINAVLRGEIRIKNTPLGRPFNDYLPAMFQGRRWVSTDPQKEARGHQLDLENKLTSPQRIISARGDDPDEIIEEILEWQKATGALNNEEHKE